MHRGAQLKRFVFMSSSGAVINAPYVGFFDERSWNEGSIMEVAEKKRNASPMAKYRASKTLAEKGIHTSFFPSAFRLTFD